MFASFIIQIFFRYVLNNPVGWTEEVIVTAWLWTVLWGAAFVVGEAEEIRFDIIYSAISERARRVCTVLTGFALVCALRHLAARRVQIRKLHEGGAVGLSARADRPDVLGLHHLRRRLHRPLLWLVCQAIRGGSAAGHRSRQGR